jgi:sugar/nucleoside kinase (ribokinase family)
MKPIIGFGSLNLDLIFEVGNSKSLSLKGLRLDPGKEGFGSDEEFESLSDQQNRHGTLKSKSGGGSAANTMIALARMGLPTEMIGKAREDLEERGSN